MGRRLLRVILNGRIQMLKLIVAELGQDGPKELERFVQLSTLLTGVLLRQFVLDRVQVLQLTGEYNDLLVVVLANHGFHRLCTRHRTLLAQRGGDTAKHTPSQRPYRNKKRGTRVILVQHRTGRCQVLPFVFPHILGLAHGPTMIKAFSEGLPWKPNTSAWAS